MSMLCKYRRKFVPIVLLSGIVIMFSGISAPVWSAADAPATTDQQSTAATSDSPAGPAKGAEGKGRHAMKRACAEDAKNLCSGVKPGEGRIVQCLKQHPQELSPGCAEMLQQRGKGRQ